MAKEIIPDFYHFSIQIIAFCSRFVKQNRHGRRSCRTGRNRKRTRRTACIIRQRQPEFLHEQRQHTDAVFKLREILVVFGIRQRTLSLEVQLVPAPDQPRAKLAQTFFRERLNDIEDGLSGRLIDRLERIQVLAVARHAERHNRNGVHCRVERLQVVQRTFEFLTVVKSLAYHQLAVHLDAAFCKTLHDLQRFARTRVAQHFHTQLRIGRLHRNVDRRNVHAQDAVDVCFRQVGHRDIVAHQEGHARIVIFHIKRFPHAARQLVDKAKYTPIGALLHAVHQIMLKIQAERFALAFAHAHLAQRLSIRLHHL